jgi:hypothetical protein
MHKICRTLSSLCVHTKRRINSVLFSPNFDSQEPNPTAELDRFAAARHNGSLGGAWGDQGVATRSLGWVRAPLEDALTVIELEEEEQPIAAPLRSPPPPENPSWWVPTSRRPVRSRSRWEWRTKAPVMAYSNESPPWAGRTAPARWVVVGHLSQH